MWETKAVCYIGSAFFIMQKTYEDSSCCRGFKELQGRSMYVWHDDGAVPEEQRTAHPMYRQDRSADVLTFNRDLDRGGVAVPPPSQVDLYYLL